MLTRIVAAILLVSVSYTTAVFIAPAPTDRLAETMGIIRYNLTIRAMKSLVDNLGSTEVTFAESWSGVTQAISGVRQTADDAKRLYDQARSTIDQKRAEGEAIVENIQQLTETAQELQKNLSSFTTLSASGSASGEVTISGSTK